MVKTHVHYNIIHVEHYWYGFAGIVKWHGLLMTLIYFILTDIALCPRQNVGN